VTTAAQRTWGELALETGRLGSELDPGARGLPAPAASPDATAGGAGGTLHFRVLGLLEVQGSEPVAVTARRQQVVLALLLLNANQVVPLDHLINAVWGAAPPTTARAQVQTSVSVLRRSLAKAGLGERIRMRGLGYAIELGPAELDLQVFDALVARGRAACAAQRPDTARAAFRQALSLWRGEPLAGIDSGVVRAKLVRIAERRIEVLEECIDAELQLGLHHEVVGEVKALAAEYPLRERLAGQLMSALYRSGRQVEALAAYRAVRQTFVDELGLEPSPALQRLQQAILTGQADTGQGEPAPQPQPAMAMAMPVPRMLPARVPDFTGHAAVLDALRRQLVGERGADAVRVAVITGCGGVGKSAVAIEAAHALAPEFPDGQLYARMCDGPGPDGNVSEVLERFLRALGFAGPAIPGDLEGRAALYRSAIAQRRLLIVVEDATDAAQIRALTPGTPTCRLIMTSRARLAALPGASVFEIDVLDTHDGVELLAAMVGRERVSAEPSEAIELVELCGGLPLALRVAAARLAARPHWIFAQITARLRDERQRLDELTHQGMDVRAALGRAYGRLLPTAKRLFGRLGMLETDTFATWVAAPLLDQDLHAAADVLETLVDARLVDVVGGTGATARYRLHELARLYARELLLQEPEHDRSAALRRVLGAWLGLADEACRRYGGDRILVQGEAARWPLTEPLVDALLTDPLAWYELERSALLATVRQAAGADAVEHCWNLAVAIGALARAQRRFDDWRDSHERALQATRQAQDRRGEAMILFSLGTLDLREHRFDKAAARLHLALGVFEQLGEDRWRQLILRSLAVLDRARGMTRGPAAEATPFRPTARPGPLRPYQFDLSATTAEPDPVPTRGCPGRRRAPAIRPRSLSARRDFNNPDER
jgi:DNA-binding SARP family transcriptional activator